MMVSWTGELRASREKQFDISCSLRWQDLLMHVRGGESRRSSSAETGKTEGRLFEVWDEN